MAQDSGKPEFWDARYRGGVTPWDQGGVPSALARFVAEERGRPRVLVPGCGAAYEALHLIEHGWDVIAIDFSEAAIEVGRAILGAHADRLVLEDFFDATGDEDPFDIVYERAFLCALPPRLWPAYAARMAELVAPGGRLAGFFFLGPTDRGPPFAIQPAALDALLGSAFERVEDAPVADSIAIFAGRERWQVWRRR